MGECPCGVWKPRLYSRKRIRRGGFTKERRHPSKEFELLECKVYRIRNGKAYISAHNQICGDEFNIDFSDSVCKSWEFNKDMEFWLLHYTKPEESYRLIPV